MALCRPRWCVTSLSDVAACAHDPHSQVISAPYLLPKGIRLVQYFLNPTPKGTRVPAHPALANRPPPRTLVDSPRLAIFRLFLVALGVSVAVFSALSPPHARPVVV